MTTNEMPPRRGNLTLWLVLAVCVAPFLGALLLHQYAPPDSRMNYGELIQITPFPEEKLTGINGEFVDTKDLRGKWLMVQVDGGECDKQCQHKLWLMRQLRLTQGKNMDRIIRVWLIPDGAKVAPGVAKEYEGTVMVRAPLEVVRKLPSVTDSRAHIWLVDPLGNVMMRYAIDADPSGIKRDLLRLLKVSQIG